MTINEAFEDLLKKWVILSEKTRYKWRQRYYSGELTQDKMRKILKAHGYKVIQPEVWAKIKPKHED